MHPRTYTEKLTYFYHNAARLAGQVPFFACATLGEATAWEEMDCKEKTSRGSLFACLCSLSACCCALGALSTPLTYPMAIIVDSVSYIMNCCEFAMGNENQDENQNKNPNEHQDEETHLSGLLHKTSLF